MRGLYAVYTEKAKDEILGHLWLYQRELEHMRKYGHLRLMIDEAFPLEVAPAAMDPTMTLETITLWLDRSWPEREYRVYTDATRDKVTLARKRQENEFRFPVPISLLPG